MTITFLRDPWATSRAAQQHIADVIRLHERKREARDRRERAERERVRVAGEDEWTGDQTRRRR
ncbi:MAG TPA: hypothetical protein VEA69_00405 [Tepidisphaeraceae bacterium]|nr:hypothetical protein [Tepidisphaeraceae bacterium]